jgi:hypothetical protein
VARGLALGLAASVGCLDPTGPARLRSVTPHLRELTVDERATNLRDGGALTVDAMPWDTSLVLEPGQRVPLEIAVSSGDRESAGLTNELCPYRDRIPRRFHCYRLRVAMKEDRDVTEIGDHLLAAGGRFLSISTSGKFAEVMFFSPDDPIGRALRAREWPGVSSIELSGSGCYSTSCPSLTVPVPVYARTAAPGDGVVQVRSGDTVTVTYRQPGGGTLRLQLPVP